MDDSVPVIHQQMSEFSYSCVCFFDVTDQVVAKPEMCLQQHEVSTDRVMQQPFPVLCGSGLHFPFNCSEKLLLATISSGRHTLPQLRWYSSKKPPKEGFP